MAKFNIADVEDVLWSVTYRCNLHCVYCSVDAGEECIGQAELETDEIDRIIEQLDKLPNLQSIILSGGEFLLSKHFEYILDKFNGRNKDIFVITNGTYTSDKIIKTLQKYRPTLMVSADSAKEEVNSLTRGKNKLELTAKNISKYLEAGIEIVLIAVVTRHNINHICDDLAQWRKCGVRNALLQQLHAEGRGDRKSVV